MLGILHSLRRNRLGHDQQFENNIKIDTYIISSKSKKNLPECKIMLN